MHILMLIHNVAGRSGSYTRASGLADALAGLGHHVTLVTGSRRATLRPRTEKSGRTTLIESPDPSFFRLRHGGFGAWDVAYRWLACGRRKVDVVHAFEHRPTTLLPALWLRRIVGAPVVSDWADLYGSEGILSERSWFGMLTVGTYDRIFEDWTHLNSSALTVVGSYLERRAVEIGLPKNRVLRVGPGVDPNQIRPVDVSQARRRFGLSPEGPVVGYMGVSNYDGTLVAETFAQLCHILPRANLLTIGPSNAVLNESLASAGLQERCWDLGFVPAHELGQALSCADVLLLPFSNRPVNQARFPSRFGEYLAVARPIVTNRTGDLGGVVETEGVGLAVVDQPQAMAKALREILAYPEMGCAMATRSRQLAEGEYAWAHLAKKVESLYREVINVPKGL